MTGPRFPHDVLPASGTEGWLERTPAPRSIVPRSLSVRPWDDEPPPTAINFYTVETANITVPAGGTATTTIAGGGSLALPPQMWAALKVVVFTLIAPTLATNLTFIVRAGGLGIRGLNNVRIPAQVAAAVNWPIGGTWDVAPNTTLECFMLNPGANPTDVNVTMAGWYVHADDIERWTGHLPGQL